MSAASWKRGDLVPLAQRLRYLQGYRVAAVALALGLDLLAGGGSSGSLLALGGVAALAGHLAAMVVRRGRDGGRWLFGIVLLGDGLLLAALSQFTGGLAGPGRYLALLHLVVVTLVASHRTGLKLVIWHSLLVLVLHEAAEVGWAPTPDVEDPTVAMATHLALLWFVTLVTATASSVNEREILRRRYDLDALARMSSALERTNDVHSVAGVLVDHVVDTFQVLRAGVVSLRDGDPITMAAHGLDPVRSSGAVVGSLAAARQARRTLLVSTLGPDDAWLSTQMPTAANVALVPMSADDEVDDVLVLEFRDRVAGRLERRVVKTVERFASQGALALRNARLHAELVAMAQTDGLTGVANRAAFDRALEAEVSRAERTGGSFSLLLADLDHFKRVNDEHGHLTGDRVLVGAANVLATSSRPYDLVARYGGEEFAVILPATDAVTARDVADRLRADVARAPLAVPVTLSIGVVSVTGSSDAASVLQAADRALYRAKAAGRDRVEMASAPTAARETAGGERP